MLSYAVLASRRVRFLDFGDLEMLLQLLLLLGLSEKLRVDQLTVLAEFVLAQIDF